MELMRGIARVARQAERKNTSEAFSQAERIDRFQRAIANLDAADSKFPADLLKSKLASPEL